MSSTEGFNFRLYGLIVFFRVYRLPSVGSNFVPNNKSFFLYVMISLFLSISVFCSYIENSNSWAWNELVHIIGILSRNFNRKEKPSIYRRVPCQLIVMTQLVSETRFIDDENKWLFSDMKFEAYIIEKKVWNKINKVPRIGVIFIESGSQDLALTKRVL